MINFSNPSKSSALKLFILVYFIFFKFLEASRNLKNIKYTSINNFNALDLLGFEKLIMSKNALEMLESRIN